MLTYPLNKESGRSLYEQLYEGIRQMCIRDSHCRYRFRSYLSVLRSHFRARHRGSEAKVSA